MRTVFQPLVPRMEYGLRLLIRRIPYSFFLIIGLLASIEGSTQVACYSRINVSINSGITTSLDISNLTPRQNITGLSVMVEGRSSLEFTCADVGKVIMATLIDTNDQRCMVEINVEDKTPLAITCRDTLISCIEDIKMIPPSSLIDVVSSCDQLPLGVGSIGFNDASPVEYPITSDTFQLIQRTWSVKDEDGNILNCISNIYTSRFDLSTIQFPDDIEIICGQDPADTTITGGLNVDPVALLNGCGVAIAMTEAKVQSKGLCLAKAKYRRIWSANDWATGSVVIDTQYIVVIDTTKAIIDAPSELSTVVDSCLIGIVIADPTLTLSCTEVRLEDIEILIDGTIYALGDTALVYPGTYDVIYRGRSLCSNVVEPDTVTITLVDMTAPVIDCDDLQDLALTLKNGQSIWVNLDSIYRNLDVDACHPVNILGRKVVDTCDTDTRDFASSLEFCPAELRSGLSPSTIQIEVKAISSDGFSSNVCTVNIEVKEDVPPVVEVVEDAEVDLSGSDGTHTLDTSDIISMFFDNSDCISSITMTGSGTGFAGAMTGSGFGLAHTGSGIPFFDASGFFTFNCADTGTYHVDIVATDCDNNVTTESTSLTVNANGNCPDASSNMIGQVLFAGADPVSNIQVDLDNKVDQFSLWTNDNGTFSFTRSSSDEMTLSISHDDEWQKGLSVIDLKLMQNHILGFSELSTWQEAAGDIDQSGMLTASDLILVKKIILGHPVNIDDQDMPWIFSIEDNMHSYDDYLTYNIPADLTRPIIVTAAKKGDVSGDALTTASSRSNAKLKVISIRVNDYYTLYKLDLSNIESQSVFQIALDVRHGTIEKVEGPMELFSLRDHSLDILYFEPLTSNNASIDILVRHTTSQLPELNGSKRIRPLLYDGHETPYDLLLEFDDEQESLLTESINLGVQPNPSDGDSWLTLGRQYVDPSDIHIAIYDIQGRRIYSKVLEGGIPQYVFPLRLPDLPHSGLFLAQVRINQNIDEVYIVKN